jgi:transcriptional antiterminator
MEEIDPEMERKIQYDLQQLQNWMDEQKITKKTKVLSAQEI